MLLPGSNATATMVKVRYAVQVCARGCRRKETGLFLPAPSVTLAMTTCAKRYQVLHHIVTEPAPGSHMMDLQAFHGTAFLAPPTISLQNAESKFRVLFGAQLKPRLFLT